MKVSQAVAVRDQLTKQALIDLLGDDPATMSKINAAFSQGSSAWEAEIGEMVGPAEATRLRELMGHDITSRQN